MATAGLLNPNHTSHLRGLYMLEAFDPQKIPVLMVHGLWSSPETWTEMINDLRAQPEIRDRYQFWAYMYPTGQPFWITAAQMREDLARTRQMVDPNHRWEALDQMVVIGHSMGGLVSRMQTLDSGDDFWHILSDRPFAELNADPETRARLASTVFFEPNPSIRRVITIGTPHRGSSFANDYTRWLGRKLITLPTSLIQVKTRVVRDNPGSSTVPNY
jgi:triacylglycerol esterase/lipase EstA (alpha/beta hydrolase family)